MIRPYTPSDQDSVMALWLESTTKAHPFLPVSYWEGHYADVRDCYLPAAQTFVYEADGILQGFLSLLEDGFIGALFVLPSCQGKGIGKKLIRYAQERCSSLSLAVYCQNENAIGFYQAMGFSITARQACADCSESEFLMSWKK